jgi:hypothetical protein
METEGVEIDINRSVKINCLVGKLSFAILNDTITRGVNHFRPTLNYL